MIPADIEETAKKALEMLESCEICPRQCGVNRLEDEKGFCGIGRHAVLSSFGPHHGEEPPLVGYRGSGTIFFAGCNLGCLFCQNYDISHKRYGEEADARSLALPSLELLEGIVDIYMPDFKYLDEGMARDYSNSPGYPVVVKAALKEMHRQVGELEIDENGISRRGLLIRHLVLPDCLDDSERIFAFIAEEISKESYVNIMEQYRPCFKASSLDKLDRRLTRAEHADACGRAQKLGLHRGF
jgi:putative pyruvate formate lyase activating enzyme